MNPGVRVALNGIDLVTVSSKGLHVLTVHVNGDCIGTEFAYLDVSGGFYDDGKNDKHLTWECQRPISPGDEISIMLLEDALNSHEGKTLAELFPDEHEPYGPHQPLEQDLFQLSNRPKIRRGFSFTITTPSGDDIQAETLPDEFSFGLLVVWNWTNPTKASVSLTSNTLDNIAQRKSGTEHSRFCLLHGQNLKIHIDEKL